MLHTDFELTFNELALHGYQGRIVQYQVKIDCGNISDGTQLAVPYLRKILSLPFTTYFNCSAPRPLEI